MYLLTKDVSRVSACFVNSLWIVVPFVWMFNSMVLFDIFGDSLGWKKAIWAPLSLLFMLFVVFVGVGLYDRKLLQLLDATGAITTENEQNASNRKAQRRQSEDGDEAFEMSKSAHNVEELSGADDDVLTENALHHHV